MQVQVNNAVLKASCQVYGKYSQEDIIYSSLKHNLQKSSQGKNTITNWQLTGWDFFCFAAESVIEFLLEINTGYFVL